MKKLIYVLVLTLAASLSAKPSKGPVYTDPAKAAENPDFALQGEYADDGYGAQVVALGDGKFQAQLLHGGLPGAGWDPTAEPIKVTGTKDGLSDGKAAKAEFVDGGLKISLWGERTLKKVVRKSPTLGAKPPEGAVVLFNGALGEIKGKLDGKLLCEGASTKQSFGSFQLHLEFRLPFKPHTKPGSQDRGNSGVYTFNRYETQILDTFGIKPEFNFCGAMYRTKAPDVNMCFPPLTWQTYDITFTAPKFEGDKKVANARFTTKHNGVVIHNDIELKKGTGAGGGRPEIAKGQIFLQGHGNPVRFQNIWIKETD